MTLSIILEKSSELTSILGEFTILNELSFHYMFLQLSKHFMLCNTGNYDSQEHGCFPPHINECPLNRLIYFSTTRFGV